MGVRRDDRALRSRLLNDIVNIRESDKREKHIYIYV